MSLPAVLLASLAAYFAIALALVAWPFPASGHTAGPAARDLEKFIANTGKDTAGTAVVQPAEASFFTARDGARRLYRLYRGCGADLLVLLHGSGSDSRYPAPLARALAEFPEGPTVATLDMRGHGPEPWRRGDVAHLRQQEEDIVDLWNALSQTGSYQRFLLGGHSIGGGLSIRYAAGAQEPRPDGLVLIAPFIHHKSPPARPGSGGWATPCIPRFAGIQMLRNLGIRLFENRPVLRFSVPPGMKDGNETPLYSWRLYRSVTPRAAWKKEISHITAPTLIIAAEHDSIFRTVGYQEVFNPSPVATLRVIPHINHFELATSNEVPSMVQKWLA